MARATSAKKPREKSVVFNGELGFPNHLTYPKLTSENDRKILAELFEQILLFDRVTISTNRLNFGLYFLISRLGINVVERLLENGYLRIMIWSPVIYTASGTKRDDGSVDETTIYGRSPIAAGSLSANDLDPEYNIEAALKLFNINSDRKKIFNRIARDNYIVPDGMEFSTDSANLVIEAYLNNNLETLGLPFNKDPNQLDLEERYKLLDLGHRILESAILSKYHLKSYENYAHYEICKQNIDAIGKAYNISDNTATIFKLEGLPNLKEIFLDQKLEFESVFNIRHLSNAKYYRKWINEVGENSNAEEITKEYLKEIKGKYKFNESTGGKFLKNLMSYGVNTALGAALSGGTGAAVGYTLGLLEDYWIENILKGKNPSMFIEDIKREINQ